MNVPPVGWAPTDDSRSVHMSVTTRASRTVIATFVAVIACGPHPSRTGDALPGATQAAVRDTPRGARYEATIRRTSFGIPHIQAADLPSLGFGEGYAQAEDHLCTIADQVVRRRGERSKYFGRGQGDRHLVSDIVVKAL